MYVLRIANKIQARTVINKQRVYYTYVWILN